MAIEPLLKPHQTPNRYEQFSRSSSKEKSGCEKPWASERVHPPICSRQYHPSPDRSSLSDYSFHLKPEHVLDRLIKQDRFPSHTRQNAAKESSHWKARFRTPNRKLKTLQTPLPSQEPCPQSTSESKHDLNRLANARLTHRETVRRLD